MGKLIVQIAEFIYKFTALNILWVFFFLLGLGVFGFMPSTVALFRVVREWIKGEKDFYLFRNYFKFYKQEFIRSNINGVIFLLLLYIIYVNFTFVSYFYDESIHFFIYLVIFGISAIVLMTFVNLFSVMAHFEFKTLKYMKVAVGLVFASPINTIMQLVWLAAYFLVAINLPKLFILIGISVFAYVLMSINYSVFKKYKAV
ncbi:hypothetical protein AB685_20615 [Bacillus sp. LL01]|uniref:YesL family protein n=1 Tax=Bacillus sp. LL01 TaxID=1665556 RepID=UPI00064D5687|nr:DUF624 domain-containing protein [Bacillus sp. LL01]KMJ56671.1 hypothetical protein AB685_20615 [Bacillus sp. LL01]